MQAGRLGGEAVALPQPMPITKLLCAPALPQAIEGLYNSQHAAQRTEFGAFYSSELGGIVTDPALMVIGRGLGSSGGNKNDSSSGSAGVGCVGTYVRRGAAWHCASGATAPWQAWLGVLGGS